MPLEFSGLLLCRISVGGSHLTDRFIRRSVVALLAARFVLRLLLLFSLCGLILFLHPLLLLLSPLAADRLARRLGTALLLVLSWVRHLHPPLDLRSNGRLSCRFLPLLAGQAYLRRWELTA